jgi:thiol-disulfide isomerase/thioredoxin
MRPMMHVPRALLLAAALVVGSPAHAVSLPSTQVAWVPAAAPADVDRAFASARAAKKPVLLYWGASWCPPCNQLKATLFNRQDFAALSRSFVAVHVDGDRPGAQKLGQQFKVSGYPTLVLFSSDGKELTRLPGEAEADQVMALLRQGLAGGRPVRAVLADARAGQPLPAAEWRWLAFYSFDTDDQQLLAGTDAASVLAQLATASTRGGADADTAARLWLRALAASDDGKGLKADAALRERVLALLADAGQVRALADVIVNHAPAIVRVLGDDDSAHRRTAVAAFEPVLRRLQAEPALSRADRLGALHARVELARIDQPKAELRPTLPEPLLRELREQSARLDREVTDGYERQAVIPSVAYVLERAGLWTDAESLLLGNLARSASPYYLMSQLGGLNRQLGRRDEALRWYRQAYERSEGPATRLQWGAAYLRALIDLAPAQAPQIEAVAADLFSQAAQDRGAFYKRSDRSLQRVGAALKAWNKDGAHQASVQRLQARLDTLCLRVDSADGQRQRCRTVLAAAPK